MGLLTVLIGVGAIGWSLVLLLMQRDWRLVFLSVFLVFMMGPKFVFWLADPNPSSPFYNWFAYGILVESILAFVGVFFIGQLIIERHKTQAALQKMNADLEERVQKRTTDLRVAYTRLQKELFRREKQEIVQQHVERSLLQAERLAAIGTVTAGIVHNLRNPLTGIVGFAQLIKRQHPNLENLDQVLSSAERMNTMIDNLMARSRQKRDQEWIKLDVLLKRELDFLRVDKRFTNQIVLTMTCEDHLPRVWGVYTDFSQIFSNLLHNALDAVNKTERAEIAVNICQDEERVYVSVTDSGCGIGAAQKEKLFQPFFTTKNSVESEDGPTGTGLGLYMVKRLLGDYGGDIDVASAKNVGTTFYVSVPLKKSIASLEAGNKHMQLEDQRELVPAG